MEGQGKVIIEQKIGAVGGFSLGFKQGKLQFTVSIGWKGLGLDLGMGVDSDKVIDAIAEVIPGEWDNVLGEVAKKALKLI